MIRKLVLMSFVAVACGGSAAADTVTIFQATLESDNVIAGGVVGGPSTLTGSATLVLRQPAVGDPTMKYKINLPGADIDILNRETPDLNDDITAVHFHDTNVCAMGFCIPGDTAGTLHVLNIYGAPRIDDADLVVDAPGDMLSGLWDASDVNPAPPAPSSNPADSVDELFAGELFLMIHTAQAPTGGFGGYFTQIPEPTAAGLCVLGWVGLALRQRASA